MVDAHAPVVEMLWETTDPLVALDERFGFADAASAERWVADVLDEYWAVRVGAFERIVISDHNAMAWVATSSGRRLAKWSVVPEKFKRLSAIARLTHWLDGEGLPVSSPIPTSDGRLHVEVDRVSMGLQHVIEGDLLDVDDRAQVRATGTVLARLHDALEAYPDADSVVAVMAAPDPLGARVADWLAVAGEHVPTAARETLRRLVADAPSDRLPIQLVHGDIRSANVLCAGADVAALIDFEEIRLDHRIDELARSAVLLGTRFRQWGPVSPDVRRTFRAGYESVRALTPAESAWWDVLVLWYTLAFMPPGDDPTGWGESALSQVEELG